MKHAIAVGERIRNLRVQNCMTQAELAKKLYVTRGTVTSWESGRNEPDIYALIKLAETFQVSLEYLITGKKIK